MRSIWLQRRYITYNVFGVHENFGYGRRTCRHTAPNPPVNCHYEYSVYSTPTIPAPRYSINRDIADRHGEGIFFSIKHCRVNIPAAYNLRIRDTRVGMLFFVFLYFSPFLCFEKTWWWFQCLLRNLTIHCTQRSKTEEDCISQQPVNRTVPEL